MFLDVIVLDLLIIITATVIIFHLSNPPILLIFDIEQILLDLLNQERNIIVQLQFLNYLIVYLSCVVLKTHAVIQEPVGPDPTVYQI